MIKNLRQMWADGDDLKIGRILMETIPVDRQPGWAGELLLLASQCWEEITEVANVIAICGDRRRWSEARRAFQAVRRLTLASERNPKQTPKIYENLLLLAENTAKVAYNASVYSMPFDKDSICWIPENLKQIAEEKNDEKFTSAVLDKLFD